MRCSFCDLLPEDVGLADTEVCSVVGWGRVKQFIQKLGKKPDSRNLSLCNCGLTATDMVELGESGFLITNRSDSTFEVFVNFLKLKCLIYVGACARGGVMTGAVDRCHESFPSQLCSRTSVLTRHCLAFSHAPLSSRESLLRILLWFCGLD